MAASKLMNALKRDWNFGRYEWQVMCIYFISLSAWIWGYISPIFIAPKVNHWCYDSSPNFLELNQSQQRIVMGGSCTKPDVNLSLFTLEELYETDFSLFNRTNCGEGYSYSRNKFDYTATEKFDLVCEREWIRTFFFTSNLIGQLILSSLSGPLSDKYGRRPMLLAFGFLAGASYYAQALVPSLIPFILTRVICGGCDLVLCLIVGVLNMEIMKTQHRKMPRIISGMAAVVFNSSLGIILLHMRNLEHFLYFLGSAYLFVTILDYFFYPESAQWLASKKRSEDLKKVTDKITQLNGSCSLLGEINNTNNDEETIRQKQDSSLLTILRKYPTLRKRLLLCWTNTSCSVVLFFSILYSLQDFGRDLRYSVIIGAVLDIPTIFIIFFSVDRIGRQISTFLALSLAGIFCLSTAPLIQQTDNYILTVLALLGKSCVGIHLSVLNIHIPELFPTACRSRVFSSCFTVGRVVALIAPQVQLLNQFWPPLMVVLLGCLGLCGAALVPLLPETTGREMPQTMAEGEKFCSDHKYGLTLPIKTSTEITRATKV